MKNILVHLDQTSMSNTRFELALNLSARLQAHLTAYFATSSKYFSRGGEAGLRDSTLSHCQLQTEAAGVAFSWAESDPGEAILPLTTRIIYQAAYADLCIVSQPGRQPPPPRDLPERLILSSGHPVLTVPFAGEFSHFCERVMIAWRAGRASARAIADAMPLLHLAKEVILISFSTSIDEYEENNRTLKKISAYLQHHGIEASQENRQISQISLGDALLNRAAEETIDLLICGGMVAGQISPLAHHLLRQMTMPVLMTS